MKNKIDSDYGYIGNGEVQYVYRYIHPNYPWLYVGRTDDLNIFDVISDSLHKSVCLNNRLRVRKND